MLGWIAENAATVITSAVLIICVALAVFSLVKRRKRGSGCAGSCASCGCGCHRREEK